MSWRLLAFDLDGTLVPTMEDYADQAARLMRAAFGTPFGKARRDYFRTSGLPFAQQLRQLHPGLPQAETDAVADRFEAWKDGYLLDITLSPAIEALFHEWRANGHLIVVSSNNMQRYVSRMARDWPIDDALGFRPEDGFAKGEQHFAELERRFGLSRADMLFTGDSPNDARLARAAGVTFRALLTPAFARADFEAVDPEVQIIDRLVDVLAPVRPAADDPASHAENNRL
jgi:phosphoserine phosphatase